MLAYPSYPPDVDPGVFFLPLGDPLPCRCFPLPTVAVGAVFRRPDGTGFRVVELFSDGFVGGDVVRLDESAWPVAWVEVSPPELNSYRLGATD
jgi:hypothetical protein